MSPVEIGDTLTQFLNIKDMATFPGQIFVNGAMAELYKRLWPRLNDGINRWLIFASAVFVNYIATLAIKGVPVSGVAWSSFLLECLINGALIALATMKTIELIVERYAREHGIERRANGNGVAHPAVLAPARREPPRPTRPPAGPVPDPAAVPKPREE